MEVQFGSLLVVSVAAFSIPLLFAVTPGMSRVPAVVGELLAGIALGGSGLGLIEPHGPYQEFLFLFGLAFLLFLAGLEFDPGILAGTFARGVVGAVRSPIGLALVGMLMRLAVAFPIALLLTFLDLLPGPTLVAFLLSSTSLGVVLSVLAERRLLRERYGQRVLVSTVVADISTVLLLTLFVSADTRSPAVRLALVALMVALAAAIYVSLHLAGRRPAVPRLVERLSGATSQLRIRGTFALLLVFVALAAELGLEVILGAFLAGAILSSLSTPRRYPIYQEKIDAIGYGFFVPVFFILAGARLDVPALLDNNEALGLVPVLLLAVFLVKIIPAVVYRDEFAPRECLAAGVLQSAQLTLTVAGVEIGRRMGLLDEALASALVTVAVLSVLIAPILFTRLYRSESPTTAGASSSAP